MEKILVVDDNPEMLETLDHLFSFYQFQVIKADKGQTAIDLAEKSQPDIILLDAHMPGMNGFETCENLKKNRKTKNIPIVFLSAKYVDEENRLSTLKLGADDYLLKPFNSKELVTRIKSVLKKNHLMLMIKQKNEFLTKSHAKLSEELEQLTKVKEQLEENQATDKLTGLYNKNHFFNILKEEFHRALRYETSVSLILLDIDSFSRVNETLGYQIGDYILMKMANIILKNTRISDTVSRLDVENFAVIVPQTEAQGGFFEAERLRVALGQTDYSKDFDIDSDNAGRKRKSDHTNLTVSIGVATYPSEEKITSDKDFLSLAKKALDLAKTGGKNKTMIIGE